MNPERHQFLSLLRQAPARLTVDEAAWFLGFQAHEIPLLIARHLLIPLGDPAPCGTKYFAFSELERLRANRPWLARASHAVIVYRRDKNRRHKRRLALRQGSKPKKP